MVLSAKATAISSKPEVLPYEVSVIVPTYKEAENLGPLIRRLRETGERLTAFEIIVVDDDSPDQTQEVIAKEKQDSENLHLIVRKNERGLSTAVMRGLEAARHQTLVVMDADLSHPPEVIPEILRCLYEENNDLVIGSRYVDNAGIHEEWNLIRWLNSKISTLLARPFTKAKDPMSGYFALDRKTYERADELNPIGYKIGLELIAKCGCKKVGEVPIFFDKRYKGESKIATLRGHVREVMNYLRHVSRLLKYKYLSKGSGSLGAR